MAKKSKAGPKAAFRCPACGHESNAVRVLCTIWAEVRSGQDGERAYPDGMVWDWNDDDPAECEKCGHGRTLQDFRTT